MLNGSFKYSAFVTNVGLVPSSFQAEIISLVIVSEVPNQPMTAALIEVDVCEFLTLAFQDRVQLRPRKSLQFMDSINCACPNFVFAVSTSIAIAKLVSVGIQAGPEFPPKSLLPIVLPYE